MMSNYDVKYLKVTISGFHREARQFSDILINNKFIGQIIMHIKYAFHEFRIDFINFNVNYLMKGNTLLVL